MAKLLKLFAYAKSPVKTFAVLHPGKMLKIGAYFLVGKMLFSWGKKEGRDEAAREHGTRPRGGQAGVKPAARSRQASLGRSEPPVAGETAAEAASGSGAADVTPGAASPVAGQDM